MTAVNLIGLILAVGAGALRARRPPVPGAVLMSDGWAAALFVVTLVVAWAVGYRLFGDYMFRVVHLGASLPGRAGDLPPGRRRRRLGAERRRLRPQRAGVLGDLDRVPLRLAAAAGPPVADAGLPGVESHIAWNTAVSFVTNTNWQAYSGESTMGHLTQMAGLAVQNFVSAAVGIAVAVALIRGFARSRSDLLGNFWVDLTRSRDPDPAADRGRSARSCSSPRAWCRTSPPARRSPRSPVARRRSPVARWPARRSSRSWAPTAAASTTPTRRIRSRTRRRGRTGWRSS